MPGLVPEYGEKDVFFGAVMNYKEFKKHMMPELDKKMAALGFIREGTSIPVYWRFPGDDKRLVWVVCINFSRLSNPLFSVLITPYWIPCQHKDEPFPRSVGYVAHLSPAGFSHCQYTWWTRSTKEAAQSLQEVVDALRGPGIEWFQQFSTPQQLLEEYPRAKLAADLGQYELARDLYRKELKSSFCNLLLEKKSNHSTPYESIREWQKERHERIMEEYKEVSSKTDSERNDYARDLVLIELDALQGEERRYSEEFAANARSRWLKSQLDYCKIRIEELKGMLH